MNPGIFIWILAPIIGIGLIIEKYGVGELTTPTGALYVSMGIAMIALVFGGWEAVFKIVMPPLLLIAVGSLVYMGLKSGYCSMFATCT